MAFLKRNLNLFRKYSIIFSLILVNYLCPQNNPESAILFYPQNRKLLETYSNKVLDGSVSLFIKMASLNGEILIIKAFYMDYQQSGIFQVKR